MKFVYLAAFLLIFMINPVISDAVLAQAEQDKHTPPEWFSNSSEPENTVVITVSAGTFPNALVKALVKVAQVVLTEENSTGYTFNTNYIILSNKIGNIAVADMNKTVSEELPRAEEGQQTEYNTKATEILYTGENVDGSVLIRYFEERFKDSLTHDSSITAEGLTLSDLIQELKDLGIKISHQSTLTESYVKMEIPVEIFMIESEE